ARHGVDLEQEPREKKGWHEGRGYRDLRGEKLVLRDGRNEQALSQRGYQERRRQRIEREERAPEWHAEEEDGEQHAQRHRRKPQDEIGQDFSRQQFGRRHGRRHHRLHRSALPFARDHQRRQKRADESHYDRDRARHEEIAADQLGVEPVSLIYGNDRLAAGRFGSLQGRPGRYDALRVTLYETRGIGIGTVDDHLDLRRGARGIVTGEGRGNHDDAVDPASDEILFELPPVVTIDRLEIGGRLEARGERLGDSRRAFDHEPHSGAGRVQRDAITEDKEQDYRKHEGDQYAAGVPDDLIGFLAHQSDETARPTKIGRFRGLKGDFGFAHAAAFASDACTSAMKASSIVGSGFFALATLAFNSSGEPSAIEWPR